MNIIDQIADERDKAQQENKQLKARIKRLEEQLMEAKNKHAVLVADVVLRDDKIERIAHLEAALRRIANQDYRGNRSTESQIAFEALKPCPPTITATCAPRAADRYQTSPKTNPK